MVENTARPDEVVVGLTHLPLVLRELAGLPVVVAEQERDARLGLALLRFRADDSGRSLVEAIDGMDLRDHATAVLRRDPKEAEPLDQLLAALRARFRRDYAGWTPTMGKNRVGSVDGFPHVSAGAAGYPQRADPAPLPDTEAGAGVRIGILDTAVYPNSDLDGRYLADDRSLLPATWSDPISHWSGHSTFVAGMVARQAPAAELHVRHVLDRDATASAWDVARQMARFADSGMDVLNFSFGCFTEDSRPPLLMARAVDLLTPAMVVVVAAGNHGTPGAMSRPSWPAAFDEVIAVGATDPAGRRSDFSARGPWVTLGAPGEDVRSTYLVGAVHIPAEDRPVEFAGWARWSGTSFAAGTVSGAIAAGTSPGRRSAAEAAAGLGADAVPGLVDYRVG